MTEPTQTQLKIDELQDARLLEVLEKGVLQRDSKGEPIRDAEGNLVYGPPSAAIFQAVNARLRMLDITKVPMPNSATSRLAEAAGLPEGEHPIAEWAKNHGDKTTLKLTDFDHEDDAATA